MNIQTTNNSVSTASMATAYETLVSVNNIDQSKFEKGDASIIANCWNHIFFQKEHSNRIYNAIADQSGAAHLESQKESASICHLFYFGTILFVWWLAHITNVFITDLRLKRHSFLGTSFSTRRIWPRSNCLIDIPTLMADDSSTKITSPQLNRQHMWGITRTFPSFQIQEKD